MSHALLNPLPTAVTAALPNAPSPGIGAPSRAEPGTEASFAHMLERRMKGADREPAWNAPERAADGAPRAPAGQDTARPQAAEIAKSPARESAAADDGEASSEATPAASIAPSAEHDRKPEPTKARAVDTPEPAASIAALLAGLAARDTPVAASVQDDGADVGAAAPTEGATQPPTRHAIEQLIADVLRRTPAPAPSAAAGADAMSPAARAHPTASVLAALRSGPAAATGMPAVPAAGDEAADTFPTDEVLPAAPQGSPRSAAVQAAIDAVRQGADSARATPPAAPRAVETASLPAAAAPAAQAATADASAATLAPASLLEPGVAAGPHGAHPGIARSEQPGLPQLPVPTPAGHRAWAEDVGNRVMWLVGRRDAKAELVLTPASLGKLEVSLQVTGDQTTAHFVAASAAARDALEQAMPRLREILQQAGIQLGQASVSTSGEQQARDEANGRGTRAGRADATADADAGLARAAPTARWREGSGIVDTFA